MKIISHRGNLNGPIPELENSPGYTIKAIEAGFDVEVDVWTLDSSLYFGHDRPLYGPISDDFIEEMSEYSWFHCKNFEALNWFVSRNDNKLRYFWHQNDLFTLTSTNHIWTFPENEYSQRSILVDPDLSAVVINGLYGICTDFPIRALEKI